jgi:hypothetical protein
MKSNKGNNNNPSFCLEVWGTDYNKIKNTCILAEKLGYDGFYYGESLADIDLDCPLKSPSSSLALLVQAFLSLLLKDSMDDLGHV